MREGIKGDLDHNLGQSENQIERGKKQVHRPQRFKAKEKKGRPRVEKSPVSNDYQDRILC